MNKEKNDLNEEKTDHTEEKKASSVSELIKKREKKKNETTHCTNQLEDEENKIIETKKLEDNGNLA